MALNCLTLLTRVLRRLQEESNKGDWFFWVTLSSSKDGQEGSLGNHSLKNSSLIYFFFLKEIFQNAVELLHHGWVCITHVDKVRKKLLKCLLC